MIHFKFKSALEYDSLPFEGNGLLLWELKKEISQAKRLGSSTDYDLLITNAQTNEDYTDENQLVPKNTSVVVRRIPGTGRKPFVPAVRPSHPASKPAISNPPIIHPPTGGVATASSAEGDLIKKMLQQTSHHWERASEEHAITASLQQQSGLKRFIPRVSSKTVQNLSQQQRVPPSTYICFRCGQKGHYINACPANADPSSATPATQQRIRKTTGIPKSFLQPVESVAEAGGNAMISGDGTLVAVTPQHAVWERLNAQKRNQSEAVPEQLQCPICSRLLRDAVSVPCCRKTFCDDCIREALLTPEKREKFSCPECGAASVYPDELQSNERVRRLVASHTSGAVLRGDGSDGHAGQSKRGRFSQQRERAEGSQRNKNF